jgi:hypothetical protein
MVNKKVLCKIPDDTIRAVVNEALVLYEIVFATTFTDKTLIRENSDEIKQ